MNTLGIIGAGHLGQQIAHYALSSGQYAKIVYFDDVLYGAAPERLDIIGNTNHIISAFQNRQLDALIIGVGYKHLAVRKRIFEQFQGIVPFGRVIHPSAWIDPTAQIGEGCVIYPMCCIDAQTIIHANTVLNVSCTIAHHSVVGRHCFLSPRVAMAGFIKVEERCIIGINATIIDNIHIAAGTQIGGATNVIHSVTEAGLYVGNPARMVRKYDSLCP